MSRKPGPPRESEIIKPAKNQQFEPGPQDDDIPREFATTESGLQYRILRKSDGPKPRAFSNVTVHYRGWLDSGMVFDASYKTGQPFPTQLSAVIKGWTEGVQLIGVGGMIELKIPYHLAYGEQGAPPTIPPKTDLNFIIELLEIQ